MSDLPDYATERQRFEQLMSILLDTYRPDGALIWLHSANRTLNGRTPRAVIRENTENGWADVLNAANLIDGGGW